MTDKSPNGRVANSITNDAVKLSRFNGSSDSSRHDLGMEAMEVGAELVESTRSFVVESEYLISKLA